MPDQFYLADIGADRTVVGIDGALFAALRASRDVLVDIIHLEESYDIAVSNYIEFEKCISSIVIDDAIKSDFDRISAGSDHRLANRWVFNTLSSGFMFLEHAKRVVAQHGRENIVAFRVDDLIVSQRNRSSGFAAAEFLRNHAQHYGFSTAGYTYHYQWLDMDDEDLRRREHSYSAFVLLQEIPTGRRDPKSERRRLADLAGPTGKIEIIPLVRKYVEALSAIMQEIRSRYQTVEAASLTPFRLAEMMFRESSNKDGQICLSAYRSHANGGLVEEINLQIQLEEQLHRLRRSNRQLVNLHRVVIRT